MVTQYQTQMIVLFPRSCWFIILIIVISFIIMIYFKLDDVPILNRSRLEPIGAD